MAKKRRRQKQKNPRQEPQASEASYKKVIEEGQQLAERWDANWERLRDSQHYIFDYYSRPDIQAAIYDYAKGRKISVLRTFRPMYNRIEAPEHILYIALFHANHRGMWPSLHGMVTRHIVATNQHVCDFVIEVDKMKRKECFDATRPYIQVLEDFGIYACVKFSGHVSAHVIIPGETFPLTAPDAGDARQQFAAIGGIHKRLMDYIQKVIKHPEKLDRYFLRGNHFLRLAYSMNERTGLVSLPIPIEQFDRFSWQDAEPDRVEVVEDWWGNPPEDAQERMLEFLEFTSRQHYIMREEESVQQRQRSKTQAERRAVKRGKPEAARKADEPPAAVPEATELIISDTDYQQMIDVAHAEAEWCETFLARDNLRAALQQLPQSEGVMSLYDFATQHGCELAELWRAWRWLKGAPMREYYAQTDVQECVFQAGAERRLRFWGEDDTFQLQRPEDIYPLAVYRQKSLGIDAYPAFMVSVARYRPESQFPYGFDLVLEIDGQGQESVASEIASEIGKTVLAQSLTVTAYHAGTPHIYLWVGTSAETSLTAIDFAQKNVAVTEATRKAMRHAGLAQKRWQVLKRDAFMPAPGSLNLYTGLPCKRISG